MKRTQRPRAPPPPQMRGITHIVLHGSIFKTSEASKLLVTSVVCPRFIHVIISNLLIKYPLINRAYNYCWENGPMRFGPDAKVFGIFNITHTFQLIQLYGAHTQRERERVV